MLFRPAFLLAVALAAAGWSNPTRADLIFSFDSPGYAIANVGGTASIGVYVTQVAGALPAITATNPLLTGGVQVAFASAGAAVETGFTPSTRWDNSSLGASTSGANTVLNLTLLSLAGVADLSSPLLLGTFTFTGRGAGSTTVSVATIRPGINFIDGRGDNLDPTNTPAAVIRVGPATAVPEPASLVLLAIAATCGIAGRRRG